MVPWVEARSRAATEAAGGRLHWRGQALALTLAELEAIDLDGVGAGAGAGVGGS